MVERVELKIDGMYQVDSLHHQKYILYFQSKYVKKSTAGRQSDDSSVPGDTAQRCSVSTVSILCYFTPLIPAEESTIQIAATPCLVLFQLRSVGILHRVYRTTRRHTKDRNLSPDHLEQFHTQLWPTPALTKSRCSVRIVSAIVVSNSTNSSTVGNFILSNDCQYILSLRYVLDFTTTPSRNIASLRTSSHLPRYVCFASNVMSVGDGVSDATFVNTVLQQCAGKVVRLNIQFEITYSTTVVQSNTTMALVVLMERCNFVSAGTDTEATGHFTLQTIYKGVPHLYYLSERRG